MRTSREEFLQEIKLRKVIREHIDVVLKEEEQALNEEKQFRTLIRKLIMEAEEDYVPNTTGEAAADNALQATTTQVYEVYKSMPSSKEERASFRAHFLVALEGLFTQLNAEEPQKLNEEEEIQVSVDEVPDGGKFIPPPEDRMSDEEKENKEFEIDGLDTTGRDYAQRAWKSVTKQIGDYYAPLTGQDRKQYADLMMTNYKIYMDNWEKEFEAMPPEPESPGYTPAI